MVDEDVQPSEGTVHNGNVPGPAETSTVARNGASAHPVKAPVEIPAASGPVGEEAPSSAPIAPATPALPGAPRSFFGRIIGRVTRFQTARQDAVNAQQDSVNARQDAVNARLAAQLGHLEAMPREIAALRRDLHDAAIDFGVVADRMRAFENTRRVVDRMPAYRSEVRNQRRQIAELREHLAALSARLSFFQREGTPLRSDVRAIRNEIASLRTGWGKLEDVVGETQDFSRSTAERLDELARDAEENALRSSLGETELHAAVEELERRLSEAAQHVTSLIEARGRESEIALGELRSELAANHDHLRRSLHDPIDRALRTSATLRTAFDSMTAEVAGDRERSAAAGLRLNAAEEQLQRLESAAAELAGQASALEERAQVLMAVQQRVAEIADAVDRIRHATAADQAVMSSRISDIAGALNDMRDSAAADRAATASILEDGAPIRSELERLAAELASLRSRLLATPYMSAPPDAWPALRLSTPDDFDYLGFENVFRGPEAFIRERLRAYLPLVEGRAPIVELGSGRGEFLEIMRENGLAATGVELNPDAVARMRAKGLENVVTGDANAYLAGLAESSVGAIFSAQFAEHLPFAELLRCLELARTRLVPGGVFIAETVNPNSIEAWKTFYVDLSHEKPLFPEVFVFLCRSMGFSDVRVFYPNGGGFEESLPTGQHEYAVVATVPSLDGSQTETAPLARDPRRRPKARSRE